ncbi:hypothetical protein GCM10023188_20920 [Pontibacter saemangeumensis]|uniref:NADPH-dependent FMN reductase-like domain-containing protein n=1 Tax=Pontibacter saemangeumensis TaxID=1084525 RepID=A0ABP8LNS1_9BACT
MFVTPEYNHGVPAALKNAPNFFYKEWNNKATGFVRYGNTGGSRSVEHLRNTMAEFQTADVRLSSFTGFENYSVFKPAAFHEKKVNFMLDQVVSWGAALKRVHGEKMLKHEHRVLALA